MDIFRFAVAALAVSASIPLSAAADVTIKELVLPTPEQPSARKVVGVAKRFYQFWDTGDATLLSATLSPAFVDHTLPAGRPQGPQGPAFASANFRKAVPDLRVTVEKMVVAGEYVTVHMAFTGHFSGRFGPVTGKGQPIRFIATDLIRVQGGRVTDNWHIEDNLTFFQQAGLVQGP